MQKPNASVSKVLDAAHLMQQNPEVFAKNMLRLMEEGSKVAASMAEKSAATKVDPMATANDAQAAAKMWGEIAQSWMNDPKKLMEMQSQLTGDFFKLWQQTTQRMLGQDAQEVAKPDTGDAPAFTVGTRGWWLHEKAEALLLGGLSHSRPCATWRQNRGEWFISRRCISSCRIR